MPQLDAPNADRSQTLAAGLALCLAVAALLFGGTEPFSWAAVQLAVFSLFGYLLWSSRGQARAAWLWKGPALLLGYALVETAVVRPPGYHIRAHLTRLMAYLSVFLVSAALSRSARCAKRLVVGLLALAVFESLYGLVQYLTGWQQIFTYRKTFYIAQATGTYINPNHFAGLLEMVLPFTLAWGLCGLERLGGKAGAAGQPPRRSRGETLAAPVFFFFSTLLLFVGILFSRSRMGILTASATTVAMGLLWFLSSRRRPAIALGMATLLAATCLFGAWIGLGPVVERYEAMRADLPGRLSVWKDSLALLESSPVWGSGLGTFADAYTRVQTTLLTSTVDHAHSDYMEVAAELGIPGAVLLFGMILSVLVRGVSGCVRAPRPEMQFLLLGSCGSILALLLHSLADFNLQMPANALVFAAILGLACAASTSAGTKPAHPGTV